MAIQVEEIVNTQQFHKLVEKCDSFNAVYRGEPVNGYKLIPKFGRVQLLRKQWQQQGGQPCGTLDEFSAIEAYKRYAIPFLDRVPDDDWEWLANAQHHGLPTRLLDWTQNPLVAAYFALPDFYRSDIQADAVIYAFDENELKEAAHHEFPFTITEDMIFSPKHITPRITAQSGVFTVHCDPIKEFAPKSLQKWIIKKECVLYIRTMIRCYGTHEASVFPGLDGVAKKIAYNYGLVLPREIERYIPDYKST